MSDPLQKIVRRKLSHEVADRLIARIESGEIPSGSQLPSERDLMEQFGVGRPAVREALQSLHNMGLIEISHGERAVVNALDARALFEQVGRTARHILLTSPQSLNHLKQARMLFECGMVRIAAEQATEAQVEQLKQHVDTMERNRGRAAAFVDADLRFHMAIAAISGNPICVATSEAMLQWLAEFRSELVHAPGKERVTIAEHRKILERIAAHDVHGAIAAMQVHLERVSELYRKPTAPADDRS
jgi:DNA-binding FadR family transcriptional regulator